jgi:hypothetical protein
MLAISVIDDVAQYLAQGTIPPREGGGIEFIGAR